MSQIRHLALGCPHRRPGRLSARAWCRAASRVLPDDALLGIGFAWSQVFCQQWWYHAAILGLPLRHVVAIGLLAAMPGGAPRWITCQLLVSVERKRERSALATGAGRRPHR